MASEHVFMRFKHVLDASRASRTALHKRFSDRNCDLAWHIARALRSTYALVFALLDAELDFAAQPFCMPILLMENRLTVLKCADTTPFIFQNAYADFVLTRECAPPDCGWLVQACRNIVDTITHVFDNEKRGFESAQGRIVQKELELTIMTAQTLLEPTSPGPTGNDRAAQAAPSDLDKEQAAPSDAGGLAVEQAAQEAPSEPEWVTNLSALKYLKLDAASRQLVRDDLARYWEVQDEIDICARLTEAIRDQNEDLIAVLLDK